MQFTPKIVLLLLVTSFFSSMALGPAGILLTLCFVAAIAYRVTRGSYGMLIGLFLVTFLLLLMGTPRQIELARNAARSISCANNLKQIGVALRNYHDHYGSFPPSAVTDAQGNKIHSWRALILPFLDELPPCCNYDFKQPWNGPDNRKLISAIPPQFRCPSDAGKNPTQTTYLAVTGPGTAWPDDRGSTLNEFTDGPDNTILLVELANSRIDWMEPRDITLKEALGSAEEGKASVPRSTHSQGGRYFFRDTPIAGFALFADGYIRVLYDRLPPKDLAALLSKNGGEPVNLERLLKPHEQSLLDSLNWAHCIGLPLYIISLIWLWYLLVTTNKNAEKTSKEALTEY